MKAQSKPWLFILSDELIGWKWVFGGNAFHRPNLKIYSIYDRFMLRFKEDDDTKKNKIGTKMFLSWPDLEDLWW